jgi:hypothetical protein
VRGGRNDAKLADRISTCLDRATIAEQRAGEAGDPVLKRCYDEMAKTWRHLAASYELERFVINLHRTKNALPIAPF